MISIIKNKFSKKNLSSETKRGLKHSLYLTIATALSQLIIIVGFIYIPNRLGVHDYGIYSTALSFVALFYIFGFEGLSKVVIREKINNEENIMIIFNKLFNFKLLIALLQILLIIIIALLIPKYNMEIFVIIIIASNEALFRSLKTIPSAIIQADERIKTLAKINVTHSLFRVGGIVLVLFVINDLIYVMSYVAIMNFIFLYVYYKTMNLNIKYDISVNIRNIKIPKKLFYQGLVFTIIGMGSVLSTKIDVFMISLMSTLEDVGIYSLSEKIVFQFEMLRGIILTAFYPIVIKHFKDKKIKLSTLYLLSGVIFIIGICMALVYSMFAHDIIKFLYSPVYINAAGISVVLFFYLAFVFSNLPFSTALQSVGLEKTILYIYPFSIILNISLNYYLFNKMGIIGLAYSTLIVQAFILIFLIFIGSYQLKQKGYTI